jgi:hypothetical protein
MTRFSLISGLCVIPVAGLLIAAAQTSRHPGAVAPPSPPAADAAVSADSTDSAALPTTSKRLVIWWDETDTERSALPSELIDLPPDGMYLSRDGENFVRVTSTDLPAAADAPCGSPQVAEAVRGGSLDELLSRPFAYAALCEVDDADTISRLQSAEYVVVRMAPRSAIRRTLAYGLAEESAQDNPDGGVVPAAPSSPGEPGTRADCYESNPPCRLHDCVQPPPGWGRVHCLKWTVVFEFCVCVYFFA